jgi:hypothetical protein
MNLMGIKILMLGASHLATPGYFGTVLHNQLADQGAIVHTVAVCGAFPSHWATPADGSCGSLEKIGNTPADYRVGKTPKTKSYTELVASDAPNLVILVMGDSVANYAGPFMDKKWASQEISKLTSVVGESKVACVFIGPPWGTEGGKSKKTHARTKEANEFLKNSVKPCTYVDSLKMSKPGEWATTDGMHLTQKDYKEWAARTLQEIQNLP